MWCLPSRCVRILYFLWVTWVRHTLQTYFPSNVLSAYSATTSGWNKRMKRLCVGLNGCISFDLLITDTNSVACTWVCGDGVDVWFWKQHGRDHKCSLRSALRVYPQGGDACYMFCGSNVGTACSKASHPPCDLRATPLCLHTEKSVSKVELLLLLDSKQIACFQLNWEQNRPKAKYFLYPDQDMI